MLVNDTCVGMACFTVSVSGVQAVRDRMEQVCTPFFERDRSPVVTSCLVLVPTCRDGSWGVEAP